MGMIETIKSLFGGQPAGASVQRDTNRTYIVDGDSIYEGRGNAGPAERAALLQRMAAFAAREKIQLQLVMGGRPLREAAHGDEVNGTSVYYAEQGGGMAEQVAQLAQKTARAVVITSNREVEQKVSALGARLMKGSTLRKALEGEGQGGGEEGGGGGGRDRGGRRDRGDRGGRGERGDRGERRDRGERGDRGDRGGDRGDRPPRESREQREQREAAAEPAADTGSELTADSTSDGTDDGLRRGPQPTGPVSVKNLIDLVE